MTAELTQLHPHEGITQSLFLIHGKGLENTKEVIFQSKKDPTQEYKAEFGKVEEIRIHDVRVPEISLGEYNVFVKDKEAHSSNKLTYHVVPGLTA
jgi:hypothetical protein